MSEKLFSGAYLCGAYFLCINAHTHTFGTDAYKQSKFIYTGKENILQWYEYGIELQFPSITSEVHIEGTLSVLSLDTNGYTLPKGSELVSAVYDISANKPFPKPVIVKLQHCVPINIANEPSSMSFVIANTEEGPPYKFHPLNGGSFRHESSYAEIELAHFSILAIILTWWDWMWSLPIPCFASVYYFQNSEACFVVTKNLEAHISMSTVSFSEYCYTACTTTLRM